MNKQLRIAVINGGSSAEAEVSRVSAQGVIKALRENYSQVFDIPLEPGLERQPEQRAALAGESDRHVVGVWLNRRGAGSRGPGALRRGGIVHGRRTLAKLVVTRETARCHAARAGPF